MRPSLLLAILLAGCASTSPLSSSKSSMAQMQADSDRLIVVAVANPATPMAPRAGSTPRGYDVMPRYTVSAAARAVLGAVAQAHDLKEIAAWPIMSLALHCAVLEIPATASREALLRELAADPRVRLAQPLQTFRTLGPGYNDPYVGLQRGFAAIEAAGAQQWSQGNGVRVAVIDTGVDVAHRDLQGRVVRVANFVDDDDAQLRRDRHGTAVAGVIAAVANNGEGIVGVAPGVELLVFKACWQRRDAPDAAQCNSFTLAQALAAAIDADAQIINLSLAGPADPLLTQLLQQALARGALIVGAVPPEGESGFPNDVAGVIAVDLDRASTPPAALVAPGKEILTLVPGGHYDFASGSSLAAAHVSGTLALMLRQSPRLDATAATTLLRETSGGPRTVNACAALASLRHDGDCAPPATPVSGTR
jgi:hypothetical protein